MIVATAPPRAVADHVMAAKFFPWTFTHWKSCRGCRSSTWWCVWQECDWGSRRGVQLTVSHSRSWRKLTPVYPVKFHESLRSWNIHQTSLWNHVEHSTIFDQLQTDLIIDFDVSTPSARRVGWHHRSKWCLRDRAPISRHYSVTLVPNDLNSLHIKTGYARHLRLPEHYWASTFSASYLKERAQKPPPRLEVGSVQHGVSGKTFWNVKPGLIVMWQHLKLLSARCLSIIASNREPILL